MSLIQIAFIKLQGIDYSFVTVGNINNMFLYNSFLYNSEYRNACVCVCVCVFVPGNVDTDFSIIFSVRVIYS